MRISDWSSDVCSSDLTAKLVQTLAPYRCNATLTAKGREVNAKSIMGVMLLAAGHGTPVMLRVEGEDEAAAVDVLVALFERRFDEIGRASCRERVCQNV